MNYNEYKYGDLIAISKENEIKLAIFKLYKEDSQTIHYYLLKDSGYINFRCDKYGEELSYMRTVYSYSLKNGAFNYRGKHYKLNDTYEYFYKPTIEYIKHKNYKNIIKITKESLNDEEIVIYNKFKNDLK
jgi:hypothetical protein